MQELQVESQSCWDEEGIPHTFHYYLLTGTISTGHFTLEEYGVKISDTNGNSAEFPSLTYSPNRIQHLMELLVRNMVTPTGLSDVLYDWEKENRLPQSAADG